MPTQPVRFDPNDAPAEGVRSWMQAALDAYFEQDMRRWAFRPLERYVEVRDDLAEDLRAIYQDLTPYAQERWRSATRDLLAMQGRDVSKRKATRVLIDFAALVRAHEVLDVLPTLVARGTEPSLLDQVVQTAVALASPTDASRTCLERIYTSPSFSPDYAGILLMALCHIDPDSWLSHVENLAQPMSVLASRLDDDSTALRFYAQTILEGISLCRITSIALQRLASSPGMIWLWNEWLEVSNSVLIYDPGASSGPRLSFRDNNAAAVTLDEPLHDLIPHGGAGSTVTVRRGKQAAVTAASRAMLLISHVITQRRSQGQDYEDEGLACGAVGAARDLIRGTIDRKTFDSRLVELTVHGTGQTNRTDHAKL